MNLLRKNKNIYILLFFIISPILLSAETTINESHIFYVPNNVMVDVYYNILNGMVMLFQDDTYYSLLKIIFLMGGFFVFMMGIAKIFSGGDTKAPIFDFLKYMIIGVFLLSIIYTDKTDTILIRSIDEPTLCYGTTDNNITLNPLTWSSMVTTGTTTTTNSSSQVSVSNIPILISYSFLLMNQIGTRMTDLATKYISLPGGFNPPVSGFASYLSPIGEILSLNFGKISSTLPYDGNSTGVESLGDIMKTLVQNCIIMNAANAKDNGPLVISTLQTTGRPIKTIYELLKNNDLYYYKNPDDNTGEKIASDLKIQDDVSYSDAMVTYYGKTYSCSDLATTANNLINKVDDIKISCIPGPISKHLSRKALGIFMGTKDGELPDVNRYKELALNAATMNTIINSAQNLGLGSLYFTEGKTISQFVQNSLGTGYYMAQVLPYMQMALRAILYAFFPFVFVVILLPGGLKVLMSYLTTLLWIELWGPTAAILNFFLSYMSAADFQSMYNSSFNAINSVTVFGDNAIIASVAGYLYVSVPALTWLILKGSGYMLGNIIGAIGAQFSSNLSNVEQYNKDIAQLKNLETLNNQRTMEGKKVVGLAEADALMANQQIAQEYGRMNALSNFDDKELMNLGQGMGKKSIMNNLSAASLTKDTIKNIANSEYIKHLSKSEEFQTTMRALNQDERFKNLDQDSKMILAATLSGKVSSADELKKISTGAVFQDLINKEGYSKFMEIAKKQGLSEAESQKAYLKFSENTIVQAASGETFKKVVENLKGSETLHSYMRLHNIKNEDEAARRLAEEFSNAEQMQEFVTHNKQGQLLDPTGKFKRADGTYDWVAMSKDSYANKVMNILGNTEAIRTKQDVANQLHGWASKEIKKLETLQNAGITELATGDGKIVKTQDLIDDLEKFQKSPEHIVPNQKMLNTIAGVEGNIKGIHEAIDAAGNIKKDKLDLIKDEVEQRVSIVKAQKIATRAEASALNKNFDSLDENTKNKLIRGWAQSEASKNYNKDEQGFKEYLNDISQGRIGIDSDDYANINTAKQVIGADSQVYRDVQRAGIIAKLREYGIDAKTAGELAGLEEVKRLYERGGSSEVILKTLFKVADEFANLKGLKGEERNQFKAKLIKNILTAKGSAEEIAGLKRTVKNLAGVDQKRAKELNKSISSLEKKLEEVFGKK